MAYQIFTENINEQGIIDILSKYADGFTILHGIGFWKGNRKFWEDFCNDHDYDLE